MKIAVVAVGTRGDVEPHLALAVRLHQRGHLARLAAPLDFAPAATRLGLPYHPLGVRLSDLLRSDEGAALLTSGGQPLRFLSRLRALAAPVVRRIIADVHAACANADAVCYSPLGLPAYFAARDRRIPCISTSLQPLGRTSTFPSPLFPVHRRMPAGLNRASFFILELAFWHCYRPFLARAGARSLPAWNCFTELYKSRQPMLFAFSPFIVPRPADWGPWMHATGYWTLPHDPAWRPPAPLVDFLHTGPPPVCVGFGSMQTPRVGDLLQVTLSAIRRAGTRAIVLTGWSGVQLPPSSLGGDVFVVDAVPHEWLFPQVAGVVHHGGAGTTAAACRAGVPSVILPFFFDQAFWGHVLHQRALGPAPILHRYLSVDALWRTLQQALSATETRARLAALSARLKTEDGVGAAVAAIEDAMAHGRIPA